MWKPNLLFVVLAIAISMPSSAIEYFPTDEGLEFQYTSGPVVIRVAYDGDILRNLCEGCYAYASSIYYLDASGDVFYRGHYSFCEAAPDPGGTFYEPDLLYLDFPLEEGKVWSTETTEYDLWAGSGDSFVETNTVLGTRTVTVEAGEFEVVVVEVERNYPMAPWLNRRFERWFHRQLGPVKGLVSWDGIVSTDEPSWDALKALFR